MGQLGVADRYEGSMRVGGEDEYLLVEPVVEQGRVIKYKIVFKVGNFEVSSEASRVNGELVIMESASSLDRTRITPIGTYYEHRETSDTEQWRAVSQMRTDGIRAKRHAAGPPPAETRRRPPLSFKHRPRLAFRHRSS